MQELGALIQTLNQQLAPIQQHEHMAALDQLHHYAAGFPERHAPQTPCLCLFIAPDQDAHFLTQIQGDESPLNEACRSLPSDLRLYEMAENEHRNDDTQLQAISYGMMAIDETMDAVSISAAACEGIEATCLNSFMSNAPAPQAGMLGAMIAALQADMPCLYDGDMAEKTAKLLAKLAPNAITRMISVKALNLSQGSEQAPAIQAVAAMSMLKIAMMSLQTQPTSTHTKPTAA